VLVVVGVLAFVLLGGESGGLGSLGGSSTPMPAFAFHVGRTSAIRVTESGQSTAPPAVDAAAKAVTTTLQQLYSEAFLDPSNWKDGSYDEVWPLFSDGAQSAAEHQAATLTVGANGGDTFEAIDRPSGHINVKVLLNRSNQVATVVAVVRFDAVGTRTDGQLTLFRSKGQYFLHHEGDGWRVYSFSVSRHDKTKKPKPSPSVSGSTPGASST
jgi:phage baseplate assembly protein gpV